MELLAGLSAEDRRQILASGRMRRFGAREVLFHEGDPADSFLLIHQGRVAVRVSTQMGDVVTLAVLGTGEVVGELALIGHVASRSGTVVALEPTEAWSFQRETFHALRRSCVAADDFLLQSLATSVRRLSNLVLEALYLPVETRVLRRLEDLERVYHDSGPPTAIPLTQTDLASLAGTSRATVNRVLRTAQATGLVELHRGRIVVVDPTGISQQT